MILVNDPCKSLSNFEQVLLPQSVRVFMGFFRASQAVTKLIIVINVFYVVYRNFCVDDLNTFKI
jgi:hypothetical protein